MCVHRDLSHNKLSVLPDNLFRYMDQLLVLYVCACQCCCHRHPLPSARTLAMHDACCTIPRVVNGVHMQELGTQ